MAIPLQREDFKRYRLVISTQIMGLVILIQIQDLKIPREIVSLIAIQLSYHIHLFGLTVGVGVYVKVIYT